MKLFIIGFVTASGVWMAVLYAQSTGMLTLFPQAADADVQASDTDSADAALSSREIESPAKKRRRGKRKRRAEPGAASRQRAYDMSEGVAGDELGGPGAKEITMSGAGGEDQLSNAEIDRGIDSVFNGIQRCLLLAPPDAPTTGKVVFGMHIAPNGQVLKVNLKGPNAMIRGEVGACFRKTAKSIRYRSFDGPDMIANYPVVFE